MTLMPSSLCTQAQLESPIFRDWAIRLSEPPGLMHRKIWEWCFIAQALYERHCLEPGKQGLGFAVGTEPLVSLFCSLGTSICATDLFTEVATDQGWVDTNQHASGLLSLNTRQICPADVFSQHCTFRHVDMNHIPKHLQGFDFLWSSCSLEHLGSLRQGEAFVYNAMECLKPGGIAVHTTEYNVSSNWLTVGRGGTVLYRRRDIEKIVANLQKQGHHVTIDFAMGDLPKDTFIDLPPYKHNPHLKLRMQRYVITSLGLIIQKSDI